MSQLLGCASALPAPQPGCLWNQDRTCDQKLLCWWRNPPDHAWTYVQRVATTAHETVRLRLPAALPADIHPRHEDSHVYSHKLRRVGSRIRRNRLAGYG